MKGMCRCGARWSYANDCHCANCHEHFASLEAFDAHQAGMVDGCMTPHETNQRRITAKADARTLRLNGRGAWTFTDHNPEVA